jgi:hypothetical protein
VGVYLLKLGVGLGLPVLTFKKKVRQAINGQGLFCLFVGLDSDSDGKDGTLGFESGIPKEED